MNPRYTKIFLRLRRYGLGECRGILAATTGGFIASHFSGNPTIIGYASAWSENIGYYGYFLYKEYREQRDLFRQKATILSLIKGLAQEFGPGELIDSLIVRPATMGWGIKTLGGPVGLLLGKISADLIFYACTGFLYKMKIKHNIDIKLNELSTIIKNTKQ